MSDKEKYNNFMEVKDNFIDFFIGFYLKEKNFKATYSFNKNNRLLISCNSNDSKYKIELSYNKKIDELTIKILSHPTLTGANEISFGALNKEYMEKKALNYISTYITELFDLKYNLDKYKRQHKLAKLHG